MQRYLAHAKMFWAHARLLSPCHVIWAHSTLLEPMPHYFTHAMFWKCYAMSFDPLHTLIYHNLLYSNNMVPSGTAHIIWAHATLSEPMPSYLSQFQPMPHYLSPCHFIWAHATQFKPMPCYLSPSARHLKWWSLLMTLLSARCFKWWSLAQTHP